VAVAVADPARADYSPAATPKVRAMAMTAAASSGRQIDRKSVV
jgi:hypothetical protein